jgi:hypothetical protein
VFVRFKKRKLKYDTAIDILLLESYRDEAGQPKHKFIKQFTKRLSEVNTADRKQWFIDDIECDLVYVIFDNTELQKILCRIKKWL